MFVSNYVSSLSILNVMNKHASAMAKHMSHIATGSRIASVAEDPSGWAIGMRMSVQIRGLDQANRNAQQYKSMLKVADGGVSSTVDILRTLKEKAIEAANDTCTDSDRQTIQKLFNQYADQIDDNALITYNGKYLINGSHNTASKLTNQAYTNSSLSTDTTTDTKLTDLLRRNGDSLNILADDTVNVSYVKDGKTYTTSYKVENTTVKDIFTKANAIDTAVFDVDNMSDSNEIGVDETGRTVKTVDDKNALTIKAKTAGTDGAVSGFTISITDKNGQVKKNANSSLDAFTEKIQPRNENSGDMLYAQVGTKSNQGIKLGLGDMTSLGLGLRSKDGDVLNVTTRDGANAAISVLDNALNRALDQQTTIGAVSSRMDYTIQNLTTQSENTTAAMSTLMDANLAKEMVEYTKENILLQAAQAMLAQNNKNAAWFLSLLQ
ncbi:MAG: flagellin [Selenomonadales bacterium]|nr:flagellin [Selenomonadales bacterium]